MTAPQHDDDFTELTDAQIDRVDLVGSPANGRRFLLRKAADDGLLKPLVPAEMVEALVAKAEEAAADVAEPVAKDSPVEVADIRPDAPTGGTAETLPGSPDWEAHDADTAMAAVAVLGRVAAVLGWLAERETVEAVAGDGADACAAWDLEDMAAQVDSIIGRLAGFAAGEQLEADLAVELEAVGKAVADIDHGQLAVLEALAPVAKAGRTLSAANEGAIRSAVESLTKVLDSLPAAPAEEGAPVAKTEEPAAEEPTATLAKAGTYGVDPWALVSVNGAVPHLTARDAFATVAAGGSTVQVAKAKGDPQMAVFTAEGKLVGVIDPADLNPIAATEAPAEEQTPAAEEEQAPAEELAPVDEAAAPAAPAAAPAAEDARTIPGTNTVQAPAQDDDDQQQVTKAVAAGLAEALGPFAEQLAQFAQLAKAHEDLKETVAKLAAAPDDRNSPLLNGATAAGPMARDGQAAADPLADLRKAVDEATTDGERRNALQQLAFAQTKGRFAR